MKITKQERGLIFEILPKNIKKVFVSDETTSHLKQLGTKYNFTTGERKVLGEAVGLVLLGIDQPKGMQEALYKKLNQDEETVNKIVRSVQEEIFRPIKSELKNLDAQALLKKAKDKQGEEGQDGAETTIPVPPPPGGGGDTPTPSYGGASDPYREPTDE